MNLDNLNLVELNTLEVVNTDGGNGIHSGGYGLAGNSNAVGDFIIGFFEGLLGY